MERKNSSVNTSVMVLSYRSSSRVRKSFMISRAALSLRVNFPSVWASFPRSTVARHRE